MEPTRSPIYVGIDVSKDRLDVAILPGGEIFAVTRDAAGIDALAARLAPLSRSRCRSWEGSALCSDRSDP